MENATRRDACPQLVNLTSCPGGSTPCKQIFCREWVLGRKVAGIGTRLGWAVTWKGSGGFVEELREIMGAGGWLIHRASERPIAAQRSLTGRHGKSKKESETGNHTEDYSVDEHRRICASTGTKPEEQSHHWSDQ